MSVSYPKAGLLASALIVSLATVCLAEDAPMILLTTFTGADAPRAESVTGVEARIAAAIEASSAGSARGSLADGTHTRVGLEAGDVRALANSSGAAYVVVGKWLSAGSSQDRSDSYDAALALRSGHSGATEFRYRLDLGSSEPTDAVVEAEVTRLARAMLHDLRLIAPQNTTSAVGAGPVSVDAPQTMAFGSRTDFLKISRDEPIEIESDELEVVALESAKQFTFTNHVHVVQGEMELFAGHLTAIYPDGASQPERLDASENVRMVEGDLEVRCHEVTYLREDGLVICRGDALLVQGCDEVRGREIEFYLDEERVKVLGAASVVLRLDREDNSNCESGGTG